MTDQAKNEDNPAVVVDEQEKHPIDRVIRRFVTQADSLDSMLPLTMFVVAAAFKSADDKYQKYIEDNKLRTEREEKGTVVYVPSEHLHRYSKLSNRRDLSGIAATNIPRVFVVSLVSHFDTLVGSLLRTLFIQRRELLNASERTLTLKDLSEFDSIGEAWDFVIEKEIEAVIRKSHLEQFEWMEQKFKIPLRKDLPSWPVFLEVTERRNLFVHRDGLVSSHYLKMCREHGFASCEHVKLDMRLEVTRDYFRHAHECVMEIGLKLCHVLWRKIEPTSRDSADQSLNDVCLQLIADARYRLAINLLDFATETIKIYSSEQSRRIFVINRAQAYKWFGEPGKAAEILSSEDWSACGQNFQLAVAVLRDDFKGAAQLMRAIGPSSSPTKDSYLHWPLFRDFKKSEDFGRVFQELFGEKPETASLEAEHRDTPAASDLADSGDPSAVPESSPDTEGGSKGHRSESEGARGSAGVN